MYMQWAIHCILWWWGQSPSLPPNNGRIFLYLGTALWQHPHWKVSYWALGPVLYQINPVSIPSFQLLSFLQYTLKSILQGYVRNATECSLISDAHSLLFSWDLFLSGFQFYRTNRSQGLSILVPAEGGREKPPWGEEKGKSEGNLQQVQCKHIYQQDVLNSPAHFSIRLPQGH